MNSRIEDAGGGKAAVVEPPPGGRPPSSAPRSVANPTAASRYPLSASRIRRPRRGTLYHPRRESDGRVGKGL